VGCVRATVHGAGGAATMHLDISHLGSGTSRTFVILIIIQKEYEKVIV
jgi:hypothetical protein